MKQITEIAKQKKINLVDYKQHLKDVKNQFSTSYSNVLSRKMYRKQLKLVKELGVSFSIELWHHHNCIIKLRIFPNLVRLFVPFNDLLKMLSLNLPVYSKEFKNGLKLVIRAYQA